jgi:hypothetical protein
MTPDGFQSVIPDLIRDPCQPKGSGSRVFARDENKGGGLRRPTSGAALAIQLRQAGKRSRNLSL